MVRRNAAFLIPVCLVLFLFLTVEAAPAHATLPVITKATVDLEDPPTLFLEGKNCGSNPKVYMGRSMGDFDQLTLLSLPNSNFIEAGLPTTEPGTYIVVVQRGFLLGSIDLTIGGVGHPRGTWAQRRSGGRRYGRHGRSGWYGWRGR